jgi:hypothetical protein
MKTLRADVERLAARCQEAFGSCWTNGRKPHQWCFACKVRALIARGRPTGEGE